MRPVSLMAGLKGMSPTASAWTKPIMSIGLDLYFQKGQTHLIIFKIYSCGCDQETDLFSHMYGSVLYAKANHGPFFFLSRILSVM